MADWLQVAKTAISEHGAIQKPGELAGLLEMVAEIKPRVIVEIGCDEGGTLYAWSQLPGPPRVIGVDLPSGPFRNATGLPEPHGAELVIGDSHRVETFGRVLELLGTEQADVLFIDGDHTYPGVRADFEWWRQIVRKGGFIVFHDVVVHEQFAVGVHQLWEEISERWPCTEIVTDPEAKWGGIGVLCHQPLEPPPPIRVPAR
jgi:cephalosporin hydroxylase